MARFISYRRCAVFKRRDAQYSNDAMRRTCSNPSDGVFLRKKFAFIKMNEISSYLHGKSPNLLQSLSFEFQRYLILQNPPHNSLWSAFEFQWRLIFRNLPRNQPIICARSKLSNKCIKKNKLFKIIAINKK